MGQLEPNIILVSQDFQIFILKMFSSLLSFRDWTKVILYWESNRK